METLHSCIFKSSPSTRLHRPRKPQKARGQFLRRRCRRRCRCRCRLCNRHARKRRRVLCELRRRFRRRRSCFRQNCCLWRRGSCCLGHCGSCLGHCNRCRLDAANGNGTGPAGTTVCCAQSELLCGDVPRGAEATAASTSAAATHEGFCFVLRYRVRYCKGDRN